MNRETTNVSLQKHGARPVIKQRLIKLAQAPKNDRADQLSKLLMTLNGVKSVAIEGHQVAITYDLLHITELQIEEAIIASGEQLVQHTLGRLHRAWIHHLEETELENRKIKPAACCNRPPPGA